MESGPLGKASNKKIQTYPPQHLLMQHRIWLLISLLPEDFSISPCSEVSVQVGPRFTQSLTRPAAKDT